MAYCGNCGKILLDEVNTNCPNCGSPFDSKTTKLENKSLNQCSPRKNEKKTGRILALCIMVVIATVVISWIVSFMTTTSPAEIKVVDVNFDSNEGATSVDYHLSGRILNTGESPSNPIILQIRLTDRYGDNLLTAQTSPEPSILQPGQEAPFGKEFTDADINSYEGPMNYEIILLSA